VKALRTESGDAIVEEVEGIKEGYKDVVVVVHGQGTVEAVPPGQTAKPGNHRGQSTMSMRLHNGIVTSGYQRNR
jgi:hypothetical protein